MRRCLRLYVEIFICSETQINIGYLIYLGELLKSAVIDQ